MFRKKAPAAPLRLNVETPTWFFLVEVLVTGNNVQPWKVGSQALVQAFSPARKLEDALQMLDEFLPTQELQRTDTIQARRYDSSDDFDELPDDYMRRPLEIASATGQCQLGIFTVSQDMAWPRSSIDEASN